MPKRIERIDEIRAKVKRLEIFDPDMDEGFLLAELDTLIDVGNQNRQCILEFSHKLHECSAALDERDKANGILVEYNQKITKDIEKLEAEVKRADNRHSFQLNKRLEAGRKVAELEADNDRLGEALDPLESFIHFLEINNATIQILEGHIRRLAAALKPKRECEHKGCHEEATCGTPTKYGYKGLCPKHYNQASEALKKELNKD